MMSLVSGLKGKTEKIVLSSDTASHYGSGLIEVFATPAMIAFMEKTCLESVADCLPEGYTTVGSFVQIYHFKPTPVGMKVCCISELVEVENSKLVFKVIATDEKVEIGSGTHIRYIVNSKKFMEKF